MNKYLNKRSCTYYELWAHLSVPEGRLWETVEEGRLWETVEEELGNYRWHARANSRAHLRPMRVLL